jgi:hypothetical protein
VINDDTAIQNFKDALRLSGLRPPVTALHPRVPGADVYHPTYFENQRHSHIIFELWPINVRNAVGDHLDRDHPLPRES